MDTRKVYQNLVHAVRDRNDAMVERIALTVFSTHELNDHLNRLHDRLHGERGMVDTLAYRKRQFNQPSSRSCGRDKVTLSALRESIDNLTEDVRIISRIAAMLGSELNRRGSVVAMVEERHTSTKVTCR